MSFTDHCTDSIPCTLEEKATMSVELDASFEPLTEDYLRAYCKPAYRVKWLKNKGAILILIWNYLVFSVYYLLQEGYKVSQLDHPFHVTDTGVIMWCMTILFPIGGWLADTRIGRYRMIHYSMLIMWIGVVLATFAEVLLTNISATDNSHIKTPVYVCLCILISVGFCGFVSNVVHLGIDQLADASAAEITSFITWYTVTVFVSGITIHYTTDCLGCMHDVQLHAFYIRTLVVAICLTVALCLDFLFQNVLVKEHVGGNPLRMIIQVIRFVVKHRHLNPGPSRFDVAKHMYGGPFTSQQVDNVRKFLWMLIVFSICSLVIGSIQLLHYVRDKAERHLGEYRMSDGIKGCYKNLTIRYSSCFFLVVIVVLYEFILHPLFYRCLPNVRITSKFLSAIAILLLWILSLLSIETVLYQRQNPIALSNHTIRCAFMEKSNIAISFEWYLIPSFFEGLSFFLLLSSALEFVWAQTPSTMKGLILGLGFMFIGLSTILHTILTAPFVFKDVARHVPWERAPLTCEIWYYLMEGFITLVVLVTATVVIKKYNCSRRKERNEYFDPVVSGE